MPRHNKERNYSPGMSDCFDDEKNSNVPQSSRGFNQFLNNHRNAQHYKRGYYGYTNNQEYEQRLRNLQFAYGHSEENPRNYQMHNPYERGSNKWGRYKNRSTYDGDNFPSTSQWPVRAISDNGGGYGNGRHPSHLKGKEIGLWHARKNKLLKNQTSNDRSIYLSKIEFQRISNLLKSYGKDLNVSEIGKQIFASKSNDVIESTHKRFDSDEYQSDMNEARSMNVTDREKEEENDCAYPEIKLEQTYFESDGNPLKFEDISADQFTLSEENTPCSSYSEDVKDSSANEFTEIKLEADIDIKEEDYEFWNIEDKLEDVSKTLEICDSELESPLVPQSLNSDSDLDNQLRKDFLLAQQTSKYQKLLKFRCKLPVYEMKEEILNLIENNQVIVLSGETGSGKTTQVPQFILDYLLLNNAGSTANILTTQPRRISAISVAQRVAEERGEALGESIGYQIRLEKVLPSKSRGRILFCTTGIILQWLIHNPTLNGYSHLILDEVHERDIQADVLMTLMKDILPQRPSLKVVLMSATLNAETFSNYFYNCPTINVPGRLYPVEMIYLEDVIEKAQIRMEPGQLDFLERQNKKIIRERSAFNMPPKMKHEMVAKSQERVNDWLNRIGHRYSRQTLDVVRALGEHCEPPADMIAAVIDHIINNSTDGAVLVFVPGSGVCITSRT